MMVVVSIVGWWGLQWLVYKWVTEIQLEVAKGRFQRHQWVHREPVPPPIRPTAGSNLILEVVKA